MAGTARLARDAIVAGVDEADIFGRLLVEQSIAALRIGRAVVPRAGQRRLRVRALHRCEVARVVITECRVADLRRVAAVAVGAAETRSEERAVGQGGVVTC